MVRTGDFKGGGEILLHNDSPCFPVLFFVYYSISSFYRYDIFYYIFLV